MDKFCKFDLQTLGEMEAMFNDVKAKGDMSIEHKNRAEFFARYCRSLQSRIVANIEAGQNDVLPSDF